MRSLSPQNTGMPLHAIAPVLYAVAIVALLGCDPRPHGAAGKFGFRVDPQQFLEHNSTLQTALVRTRVFGTGVREDSVRIERSLGAILDRQAPDGSLSTRVGQSTAGQILRALELGCLPQRPELTKAAQYVRAHEPTSDKTDGVLATHALCVTRGADSLSLVGALGDIKRDVRAGLHDGGPWTPAVQVKALWAGRNLLSAEDAIVQELHWMADSMNEAGCLGDKNPWGILECAGYVSHPMAARIVARMIPLILRAQHADGGWGENTFIVLRALAKYGFYESLRLLPPLPSDWRIARSIEVHAADPATLAWDGTNLWTLDRKTMTAIAMTTFDGTVVQRVKLPLDNAYGIGWWGGSLAVGQENPPQIVRVSVESGLAEDTISLEGKVRWVQGVTVAGGNLWVSDGWHGRAYVIDPGSPETGSAQVLAGPGPSSLAGLRNGLWHSDYWAPYLVKSSLSGKLVTWGEKPFTRRCAGLAWDGKWLWALDRQSRRVAKIERPRRRDYHYDWLTSGVSVEASALFVDSDTVSSQAGVLTLSNPARFASVVKGAFATHAGLTITPATFQLSIPAGSAVELPIRLKTISAMPTRLDPVTVNFETAFETGSREPVQFSDSVTVRPVRSVVCPESVAKMTVDGDLREWGTLPFVVTEPEMIRRARSHHGPDECSFAFGVSADREHVHVAVLVRDDKLFVDGAREVWEQDGVEIRLDARPVGAQTAVRDWDEWHTLLPILVSPSGAAGKETIWRADELPAGVLIASRLTSSGYATEIAIPASYLQNEQNGEWTAFRLNVAVDDFDAPNDGAQLWWKPDWRGGENYAGSGTFVRRTL